MDHLVHRLGCFFVCLAVFSNQARALQDAVPIRTTEVTAKAVVDNKVSAIRKGSVPPAVIWLSPVKQTSTSIPAPATFTLLQKDKMFTPHLLVVPVGSSVVFPNADPFFHNVFSLFDGRRFDLGLYEAGSTRSVVFSREGVSYIFCNIHSEMSAVVISLYTSLYSIADSHGVFHIKDVPDGEYELHLWVEGSRQSALDQKARRVKVEGAQLDLGHIHLDPPHQSQHLNKFGRPYDPDALPIY